jgi:hypothetical protein
MLAIKIGPGPRAGRARAHEGTHPALRLTHEPEAVAAEVVHVRIDRGDARRHRKHGFERIAAFGQDGAAGFGGS